MSTAQAPDTRGRASDGLALAVSFLTIVPVRLRRTGTPLGGAAVWFPVVGALVGAAAGGVRYGLDGTFGPGVASILAVSVLVVLTGALHLDGLADCADGLGARGDRARRLEIMRDSSIGTFGGLALLIWLLLMSAGLSGLGREDAFYALVVAACCGRWAALLHATFAAPARPDGLGAAFHVDRVSLGVATIAAIAVSVGAVGPGHGLAAVVAAKVAALAMTGWARSSLGGRTGDTLGATVTLAEVAVVLTLLGLS